MPKPALVFALKVDNPVVEYIDSWCGQRFPVNSLGGGSLECGRKANVRISIAVKLIFGTQLTYGASVLNSRFGIIMKTHII
jgi:hypothetical protein